LIASYQLPVQRMLFFEETLEVFTLFIEYMEKGLISVNDLKDKRVVMKLDDIKRLADLYEHLFVGKDVNTTILNRKIPSPNNDEMNITINTRKPKKMKFCFEF
jgi:hypothetical protein